MFPRFFQENIGKDRQVKFTSEGVVHDSESDDSSDC